MKGFITSSPGFTSLTFAAAPGFDTSHYQPNVYFGAAYSSRARLVITKADFALQANYHFARPSSSPGARQANFSVSNGGGWSGDGITLPVMLDLEDDCVGLSTSATVSWIKDFSDMYHSKTGRYPVLYTNPPFWLSCTGGSSAFVKTNPVVLARHTSSSGMPPGGWPYYTIWQFNDGYKYGGDLDTFNSDITKLKKLASG
ncbi:glycoside hydrolase family 25 protein [Daldinia sp. FL1419]|nr:glycoside hydrolase family 25 protein [Daldinia sp. FL1419]